MLLTQKGNKLTNKNQKAIKNKVNTKIKQRKKKREKEIP